ncbi:AAA family ATPase [Pseudofrankia sp. DC12]|uniref:AAA family ATPase n=1 Tax=Pseudofrankia sp. DC12 TaxID=683315 RepID=UPI000A433256|nr:AAA family ATPase [Pseudofrankia sp. DC12]
MTNQLIILVSGPSAAGKTTLATALARALELPLICKDDIKETLVDALGRPVDDLSWSRRIGGAAMELLWRLAQRCPAAVLGANFRLHSDYEQTRLRQLQAHLIEIHCVCPADELAAASPPGRTRPTPLTRSPRTCSPSTTGPWAPDTASRSTQPGPSTSPT